MKEVCKKVKFATEKDALFLIKKIQKTSNRKVKPSRAYLCRCGAWHLTSKADVFVEAKKVEKMQEEIQSLLEKNNYLQECLKNINRNKNRKDGIEARKNKIVIKLKNELEAQKNINRKIREDNKELISKLHKKNQNGK